MSLEQIIVDETIVSVSGDVPTTQTSVMKPLRSAVRRPSFKRARTPNYGKTSVPVQRHATLFFMLHVGLAERSGRNPDALLQALGNR
jgi:uncharacterized protein (DUF3084 family)